MGDPENSQAIRDILKGTGVVSFGFVLEIVIAFVAQVLAARYLTTAGFGGLTVGTAVVSIGAILSGLGLQPGLLRYLPRLNGVDEQSQVAQSAFLLSIPLSVLVGGLLALNAEFIGGTLFGDPSVSTSIAVFALAIPFATAINLAIGGIQGKKNARYRVYIKNLAQPIARFALVIGAVILGADQAGFAVAYALPYVVAAFLAIWLLTRLLPGMSTVRWPDTSQMRSVIRYSVLMIPTQAASFVYRSADIFIVLYFLDSGAVGVYGVAYAAARLTMVVATGFNYLSTPIASALESEGEIDAAVDVHRTIQRWLVITTIPLMLPLAIFVDDFITAVYQPTYVDGALAAATLALGFAVNNILMLHGNLLQAIGESRYMAANNVVASIVNVVLNLLLVPRPEFGILGAAIATFIAYLVRGMLTTGQAYYEIGAIILTRRSVAPFFVGVPMLVALIVLDVWLEVIPDLSLPELSIVTAVFGLAYIIAYGVTSGFESEDSMVIRSVEERFELQLTPLLWFVERFENE